VVRAAGGRDGLDHGLALRPDLIVFDIKMASAMLAELRQLPALQHVPVLLLAAPTEEDLVAKLVDDGGNDFIIEPFSERELALRVNNLVLAAQARDHMNGLRDAAEAANRAKDEFLAILGHELRNPLSPILTALQLMKLRGNAGSDRERTIIERQVNHLVRLVDDLLDVARIARGKIELKTEIVEIAEIVAKAIEMASPLLEQRAHTLTVSVPKRGLWVNGDTTRLSQVISNLLTNAAKYTPPGGNVFVRAHQAGGELVISVRDTGIGIAPDILPRVFDLFVQEGQAVARSQGGLGIGLTIVRSLVECHGGTVSARSDGPGKGSEFMIRLPIVAQPKELDDEAPASNPPFEATLRPSNATRILVVDDNEDGAELLAMALSGRGYDTRVALDAPTALRVAAEFAPDIAFLDIGLPIMDGCELASQLRELPGLANLQLVAITGYGQESDRLRTRQAGFHHHLVKPVDMETVEATVTRLDTRH
jgi:signal transduction histidine kinase/ActR/RegA family two-component response regulator